ncbi:MAG: fluoride efflux transporter CrcB [Burkholderiales bacterium]|nr:MAG: fluoride efflux transporter CrcB [Burkholderiales bacterium]
MILSVTSICAGASFGALLRWLLGTWLNHLWPSVPLGTLAANVVGGYLIGLAFAYFAGQPTLSPEWRLLIITGFLGGLTTFSTFSVEVVTAAQRGDLASALAIVLLHLLGSLAFTVLGIATFTWARA